MCRDGDPYDGVHGMPEPGLNPPKVLLYRKLDILGFFSFANFFAINTMKQTNCNLKVLYFIHSHGT